MQPQRCILSLLNAEVFRFEGEVLLRRDVDGCCWPIARVISRGESYPVRIRFESEVLDDLVAMDESELREQFFFLARLKGAWDMS